MTNISLDHYVGREVEDVNKRAGEWQVILQGDVRIINYDDNYEMPEKEVLIGLTFQRITMSRDVTVLFFGTDETPNSTRMQLAPIHYGISDPERSDEIVRPQEGAYVHDPEEDRPEEPSERLAEVEPEAPESGSNGQDE